MQDPHLPNSWSEKLLDGISYKKQKQNKNNKKIDRRLVSDRMKV